MGDYQAGAEGAVDSWGSGLTPIGVSFVRYVQRCEAVGVSPVGAIRYRVMLDDLDEATAWGDERTAAAIIKLLELEK